MSAGLHVAHVIRSLEVGGMERLVHELVRHRREGTTSVICLDRPGHFGEQLERTGFPVRAVGLEGGRAGRLWRMRKVIADLHPDVLHCHNLQALTHAGLLSSARCAPRMLTTKHGSFVPGPDRHLIRWIARRTRMVAVSREVERTISRWCRSMRFPVPVVPNGISIKAFSQACGREPARRRLGFGPEHFVVGIVARLAEEKDHRTLLDAFCRFHREWPSSRLAIIGDGPLRSDLEREADELGIASHVAFLGERHDVPELLSGLDAFALSSRTEGLPMTLLEAMAHRLPIVATDVGGVSMAVEEGVTGYLVAPGSPPALADRLLRLAADPRTSAAMGTAGRQKLEREFDITQTAARYEEIYRETKKGGRHA